MFYYDFQKVLPLVCLVVLISCSSEQKVQVTSASSDTVKSVQIYKKDQSIGMQNAALGTVPFFYGATKGVNVRRIKWNEPVSSENPGVDCDLNYFEGKGTTSHYFRCIVKEGNAHIIVSIQEDLIEGKRLLRRVFMDGKGKALINQWIASLERVGYKRVTAKNSSMIYESPKKRSVAELIWTSKTNSATLRLSPLR